MIVGIWDLCDVVRRATAAVNSRRTQQGVLNPRVGLTTLRTHAARLPTLRTEFRLSCKPRYRTDDRRAAGPANYVTSLRTLRR